MRDLPERAAAEPETIAHHFTEAGLDALAAANQRQPFLKRLKLRLIG
jgi:hypothetical protein